MLDGSGIQEATVAEVFVQMNLWPLDGARAAKRAGTAVTGDCKAQPVVHRLWLELAGTMGLEPATSGVTVYALPVFQGSVPDDSLAGLQSMCLGSDPISSHSIPSHRLTS